MGGGSDWFLQISSCLPDPGGILLFSGFASVPIDLVTMLLQTSNKTNVILCSAMLYLCIKERCYAFKG